MPPDHIVFQIRSTLDFNAPVIMTYTSSFAVSLEPHGPPEHPSRDVPFAVGRCGNDGSSHTIVQRRAVSCPRWLVIGALVGASSFGVVSEIGAVSSSLSELSGTIADVAKG